MSQNKIWTRVFIICALLCLSAVPGGCQLPETRPSAYYEHDGMWCGRFDIGFEEARVAARMTLAELHMPILGEGPDRHGVFFDTKTPDNFEARIIIIPPGRRAEGTRICVRIGGFGTHRQVSERLLGDIARHLDAVRNRYTVPVNPPPGANAGSPSAPAAPSPASSSAPSLPPQPVPVSR